MRNQERIETWLQNELQLVLLEPLHCLQESEVSTWLDGRTEHLGLFVKVSPRTRLFEARVGQVLSRFAPGLTPEVLGLNTDFGVVVTRKLEALDLRLELNTDVWLGTLNTVAKLQRSSLAWIPELQQAGVSTLDLAVLLESCHELILDTAQLEMLGLKPEQMIQIQNFAPQIMPALEIFLSSNLPSTLIHGDFHANNVLVRQGKPKLIDWSEAAFGSPLLDLGRFLEWLRRAHMDTHPASRIEAGLITAFHQIWQDRITRETFFNATQVAPFIATLVFAARAWQQESQRTPFLVAYHLRRAASIKPNPKPWRD